MFRTLGRPAALLAALLAGGCATAPGPSAAPGMPVAEVPALEERALLLLLVDRQTYEPVTIHRALDGDAELRRRAAMVLGQVGDAAGAATLESLLGDPDPSVRRAAAFALGELGQDGIRRGAPALLGAVLDGDRATGRLAVEGLAKSGATLESVAARLFEGPAGEVLPRLLPSLFRFRRDAGPEELETLRRFAEAGLEEEDPELRSMAAYAFARDADPASAPYLRPLLADPDPWVRGWAARALGSVGDRSDLPRLRPLLDGPEAGPIIHALRAGRQLVDAGAAAPPDDWRPRLLELFADPRPGVRLTAIEAAGAWLLDDALGAELARLAEEGEGRERELALLALAAGEDPRAALLLLRFADSSDPVLRARAAEAAGLYHSFDVVERLAEDPEPRVRRAALETHLAAAEVVEPEAAAEVAREALADPDPAVRATALGWAEENPELEMETLLAALAASRRDRILDARLAAVAALRARATAEPLERGAIVAVLEEVALDADHLVRREAADALAVLDREPPDPGPVSTRKPVQVYREIVQRTAAPRRVELVTERGTVVLELDCPRAPLTCLNFLQLAAQGFYDGLTFHRVVPDFVVQGGDPRGDGWGGPGYTIRDEINRLRYDRGVVGMALSGPDTGGSQFFVTLSPQPHLDGGYTAFGRVISGVEVLDLIIQGDRILRVVETPAP
jgi:cyclophilin family peptidyl-prolyl cis-trans isomerase/HEAT repeat protein